MTTMNNVLLIVTKEGMGSAPEELQTVLAINFFRNLVNENQTPETIFFYADGVKLNVKGSVIEDSLEELEKRGSKILTCTTCLNFFKLKDQLSSGSTATMKDLIHATAQADKVISI
jgi:sulfur relay (sulfurtransferase) complex TusBCD TusD component (DsrE family)